MPVLADPVLAKVEEATERALAFEPVRWCRRGGTGPDPAFGYWIMKPEEPIEYGGSAAVPGRKPGRLVVAALPVSGAPDAEVELAFETTDAFCAARRRESSRVRRLTCLEAHESGLIRSRPSQRRFIHLAASDIQLPLAPSPAAGGDRRP